MSAFRTAERAEDQEIQLFTRNRSVAETFPAPAPLRAQKNTTTASPDWKETLLSSMGSMFVQARTAWSWIEKKRTQQTSMRRLRISDTISLGEKRFVSILQVDGAQYLIGGAAGNVSLLAVLDKQQDLGDIVRRQNSAIGESR